MRISILALAAFALSGCATLEGAQHAPAGFASPTRALAYDAALFAYASPSDEPRQGLDREQYRDYVLDLYLIENENRYRAFKAALNTSDRGTALLGDLVLIGLSGATALVKPTSKDELATITAMAAGGRAAVDKRLFFDRAMPAVIAAMDARRARIRAEIEVRRRLPISQYSLGQALEDVARLADAGNIFDGVDRITADATAAKKAEEARLSTIVEGCSQADDATGQLNTEFRTLVRVNDARQQERIDQAAKLLDLPPPPAGAPVTYGQVALAFDDKFCGDAGKRAFLDHLKANIDQIKGE